MSQSFVFLSFNIGYCSWTLHENDSLLINIRFTKSCRSAYHSVDFYIIKLFYFTLFEMESVEKRKHIKLSGKHVWFNLKQNSFADIMTHYRISIMPIENLEAVLMYIFTVNKIEELYKRNALVEME